MRALRYDEHEYFWVHEPAEGVPRILMHPIKPELEGQTLDTDAVRSATHIADRGGALVELPQRENLFAVANQVVRDHGAGFVRYEWSKPGQGEALYPKLSYVQAVPEWGWVIGSGVYIDQIYDRALGGARKMLTVGVGIALLAALLGWATARSVRRQLVQAERSAEAVAMGNLAAVETGGKGVAEVAALQAKLGVMRNSIFELIFTMRQAAAQLAANSNSMAAISMHTTQSAGAQSEAASGIAAAVEQLSVSMDVVKDNATHSYEASSQSGDAASEGARVVLESIDEITRVSDSLSKSLARLNQLEGVSNEIVGVVAAIREISEQTNLLALNAAIEAARAGEQGRGFAVVADEVRKLATRTGEATTTITTMVERVRTQTTDVAHEMSENVNAVRAGVERVRQAGGSVHEIAEKATVVVGSTDGIRSAIAEQSGAVHDIAQRIEDIAQSAEEHAQAAASLDAIVTSIQHVANEMEQMMQRYQIA